jgi:hypothetical protein
VWRSSSDDAIQWGQEVLVGVGKANFQKAQKQYKGYVDKSHILSQNEFLREKNNCGWT